MISQHIIKSAENFKQNKLQQMEANLNLLHQADTQNIDILINLSTVSFRRSNIQGSIGYLEKAIQIEPFDYRVYYNLFAIYFKQQLLSFSLTNLKKCLSIIYTLMSQNGQKTESFECLERAIELWSENTPAFALKAIALIKQNNLSKANETVQEGIQKCTVKHHLYAICCIIDKKLNREIDRQKNASDYYSSLLKPVHVMQHKQAIILQKQEALKEIKILVKQFNNLKQLYQRGKYSKFEQVREILFMEVKKPTSINIQQQISSNLGVCDLACIQQEKDIEVAQLDESNEGRSNMKVESQLQLEKNGNLYNNSKQVFEFDQNQKASIIFQQPATSMEGKIESSIQGQSNKQQSVELNIQTKQESVITKKNDNQESLMKKKNLGKKKLYPNSLYTKFRVRLISATIDINQELLGKMEPYVAYEYGSQKQKTTIAKKQSGKISSWENEIKVFILDKKPNKLKISIYEREMFKWDELIGECIVEVSETGTSVVPLVLNGRKKGSITIQISAQR